jgi:hypothetical protein
MAIISDGTTIADAGAFSASLGSMVLIKTLTASTSATLSFVNGASSVVLDSTYPIYVFKFYNIHPATDNVQFRHNASTDAGSNYNLAKTNTMFEGEHAENDDSPTLNYVTGHDIANSTAVAEITYNIGNDNDQCISGEMWLYNPSSATYVKNFHTVVSNTHNGNYEKNTYTSGYYNTASDIDAVQFTFSSGNIDAGTIKLYGIKDS